jgi:hypothetical protein
MRDQVFCLDGPRQYDTYTNFHEDQLWNSCDIKEFASLIWEGSVGIHNERDHLGHSNILSSLLQYFQRLKYWYYWQFLGHDMHTKFQDLHRRSSNINVSLHQLQRLQCWYYRWEEIKKWAIEIGSVDMTYIQSFITTGSSTKTLLGRYTHSTVIW